VSLAFSSAPDLRALAEGRPVKQWVTPAGLADMSLVPAG